MWGTVDGESEHKKTRFRGLGSIEPGNFGFDMRQSRFEGLASRRVRGSLRKDVFLLQLKRLLLPGAAGTILLRYAAGFRPVEAVHRRNRDSLLYACHLFLHGFTFPATGHIFNSKGNFPYSIGLPAGLAEK